MGICDLVKKYNGIPVGDFSQKSEYAIEMIVEYGQNKGMCSALSTCWIKFHANGDSLGNSFKAKMIDEHDFFVIRSMICLQDTIRQQQNLYHEKKWTPDQAHCFAVATILRMHGLKPLTMEYGSTFTPDTEFSIVSSLTKLREGYAYIGYGIEGKGHNVALWLGGPNYTEGDACFFEPTYGEFWFKNKTDFFRFFPAYYNEFAPLELGRQRCKANRSGNKEAWFVLTCARLNTTLSARDYS